jgi:hypothetical protein
MARRIVASGIPISTSWLAHWPIILLKCLKFQFNSRVLAYQHVRADADGLLLQSIGGP